MSFPNIPDTPIQTLLVLSVALVVAATVQPTDLYEQWQDAIAERDKQAVILQIERDYLNEQPNQGSLSLRRKELDIQAAEVDWLTKRAKILRGRWEKRQFWASIGGGGGLIAIVSGMWIWWRRHPTTKVK